MMSRPPGASVHDLSSGFPPSKHAETSGQEHRPSRSNPSSLPGSSFTCRVSIARICSGVAPVGLSSTVGRGGTRAAHTVLPSPSLALISS